MNEKQESNEKSIFQIAVRVSLLSIPVFFLLIYLYEITINDNSSPSLYELAVWAAFLGLLGLPFSLIGLAIERKRKKTQRATSIGAMLGLVIGLVFVLICFFFFILPGLFIG